MIQRRGFLLGLLAAPAIIRPGLLMPVRALKPAAVQPYPSISFLDGEPVIRWSIGALTRLTGPVLLGSDIIGSVPTTEYSTEYSMDGGKTWHVG